MMDWAQLRDESGLDVDAEALQLAFELEERGFRFEHRRGTAVLTGDGLLHITPSAKLTDADRAQIRRWRDDLVTIVTPRPLASPL